MKRFLWEEGWMIHYRQTDVGRCFFKLPPRVINLTMWGRCAWEPRHWMTRRLGTIWLFSTAMAVWLVHSSQVVVTMISQKCQRALSMIFPRRQINPVGMTMIFSAALNRFNDLVFLLIQFAMTILLMVIARSSLYHLQYLIYRTLLRTRLECWKHMWLELKIQWANNIFQPFVMQEIHRYFPLLFVQGCSGSGVRRHQIQCIFEFPPRFYPTDYTWYAREQVHISTKLSGSRPAAAMTRAIVVTTLSITSEKLKVSQTSVRSQPRYSNVESR